MGDMSLMLRRPTTVRILVTMQPCTTQTGYQGDCRLARRKIGQQYPGEIMPACGPRVGTPRTPLGLAHLARNALRYSERCTEWSEWRE